MQVGRLNTGAVAANWRRSTGIVNLIRSQVYHKEHPPYFGCSTFAVMQRVARVCQRQLILTGVSVEHRLVTDRQTDRTMAYTTLA